MTGLLLLPEIARQFAELKNASQGAAIAKIVTAFPLSEAQTNELVGKLEKRFGRKLIPTIEVDKSLGAAGRKEAESD